jgi:uncharacterized protein
MNISKGKDVFSISRFTYVYKELDKVLLYNSITQKKLLLQDKVWSHISGYMIGTKSSLVISNGLLDTLLAGGFLIKNSSAIENNIIESLLVNNSPNCRNELWFFTTDYCNSECLYCRQRIAKNKMAMNLSEESALNALNLFINQTSNDQPLNFVFYGGEPLLNFGLIKYIIEELKKRCIYERSEINIITNGLLIEDKIVEYLSNTKAKVVYSIDGPEKLNFIFRKTNLTSKTYQAIKDSFDKFKKLGKTPGISLVLSASNAKLLKEVIDYLFNNFQPINIYPNLMHLVKDNYHDAYISEYYSAHVLLEAYTYFASKGLAIENVLRKIRPFVEEKVKIADCGACGNRIVVFPDGQIGPCEGSYHLKELRIPLKNNFEEDEIFKKWKNRTPLNTKKCLSCPGIGICGGGCPLDPYETNNDLNALDKRNCTFVNICLNFIIHQIFLNILLESDFKELSPKDLAFLYGEIDYGCNDQPFRVNSQFGEKSL